MGTCQVVGCDCNIGSVLVSLDNGKAKFSICPTHLVVYAKHLFEIEGKIEREKSERTEQPRCDCCGDCQTIEYKDAEITFNLCENHLQHLIHLKLSPKDFKTLYKKAGDVFILHDDFYDSETGEALQPRISNNN